MNIFLIALLAFASTVLCIGVLKPLAKRLCLVDNPSSRKQHDGSIPLIGGISIWMAFSICMLFVGLSPQILVLIVAGGLLVAVGAIDDAVELPAKSRLVVHFGVALMVCLAGGIIVNNLGELVFPGAQIELGVLAIPFTIFAIIALVNATNMSDGIDGLCGIQLLIPFAGLAVVAGIAGDMEHLAPLLIICGCLIGFLLFNLRTPWRSKASVFLGDAGSGFLGLMLGWFLIDMSQGSNAVIQPVAALWFTVMLVYDSAEVVARRVLRGRSPLSADREHLHHVFLLAGFSVPGTVLALGSFTLIGVSIGVFSSSIQAPEYSLFALFMILGVLFVRWILRTWSAMLFLRRSICRRREERRKVVVDNWPNPERRASQVDRRRSPSQADSEERQRQPFAT